MSKKNIKKATAKAERYVYLAPSCGGFMHYTVFVGELPEKLKEIKNKYPEVDRFIVPEEKAPFIMQKLRDKNDPLRIKYEKLKIRFKEDK